MTSRSTARADLLAVLGPLGFRTGRIDLPALWPAISAWLREPASDVAPEGDERSFYLSRVPRDAPLSAFAGAPPAPIAGQDLVCLDFGRAFKRADDGTSTQLGSVGVVLWYPDGPPWEALSAMPEWIAAEPSTPHVDAFARGEDAGWLTRWIETSPVFAVAAGETALAAEITDEDENLLVMAAA